ncbi:MAG: heme NO-binding domain-containing protein [Deltaproteobacteria bacterium]
MQNTKKGDTAMHGIIFAEFKNYISAKLGDDRWNNLLRESGVWQKIYMPIQEYPNHELLDIVSASSNLLRKPITAVLEDFGEFIIIN